MLLFCWSKLCVTALLVHHLSLWSNYSQFHLVTLLCPPWCTIMLMCKEIQKLGVKAEGGILFFFFYLHLSLTLSRTVYDQM